jgi:hypothetical protein
VSAPAGYFQTTHVRHPRREGSLLDEDEFYADEGTTEAVEAVAEHLGFAAGNLHALRMARE